MTDRAHPVCEWAGPNGHRFLRWFEDGRWRIEAERPSGERVEHVVPTDIDPVRWMRENAERGVI